MIYNLGYNSLEADAYAQQLVAEGAQQRVPDLFGYPQPKALYYLPDRQGVSVLAIRTSDLNDEHLVELLRYRLIQYLAVGHIDPEKVYEAQLRHEPLSVFSPDDVHFIAGDAETGEILCYLALEAPKSRTGMDTLRDQHRQSLAVEDVCGRDIFNRLLVLPDLPLAKLWELKRWVKNHSIGYTDLSVRGPVELGIGLLRLIGGLLRNEIDALVGVIEQSAARSSLEFYHMPTAFILGAVPHLGSKGKDHKDSLLQPLLENNVIHPFAVLVSDLSQSLRERVPAIERALELPGDEGMDALFALKRNARCPRSSLEPRGGLSPLNSVPWDQKGVPMSRRLELLELGEELRQYDPFQGLSLAEATILRGFVEVREVDAGQTIVQQGQQSAGLFIIKEGQAELRHRTRSGSEVVLRLGAGEYFGELGLLVGGEEEADVTSVTPLTLLHLSEEIYVHYLSHLRDVERSLAQTALRRAAQLLGKD